MSIRRYLPIPLAIIVVSIAVFLILVISKPTKPAISNKQKVWQVKAIPAVIENIAPEITVYGRVETPRSANLTSALEADVLNVNVFDGTDVEQGDLLIELDTTDADLMVTQRRADLAEINGMIDSETQRFKRDKELLISQKKLVELAKQEVKRASKLSNSGLGAKSNYDDAQKIEQQQLLSLKNLQFDINNHPARLAQLKAKQQRAAALLKQAELDQQRCFIHAPFTGRVAKLNVSIGDRVRIGSKLISLYDLSALEVRAELPDRHLAELRRIMAKETAIEAYANIDDQRLALSLQRLSGEVQADSGGIDGLFKLVNQDYPLALGTFVALTLKLEKQAVIAVPYSALYELQYLYVIKDGLLKQTKVDVIGEYQAEPDEQMLLIKSDALLEGEQIVTTQLPNAITGLPVEIYHE